MGWSSYLRVSSLGRRSSCKYAYRSILSTQFNVSCWMTAVVAERPASLMVVSHSTVVFMALAVQSYMVLQNPNAHSPTLHLKTTRHQASPKAKQGSPASRLCSLNSFVITPGSLILSTLAQFLSHRPLATSAGKHWQVTLVSNPSEVTASQ